MPLSGSSKICAFTYHGGQHSTEVVVRASHPGVPGSNILSAGEKSNPKQIFLRESVSVLGERMPKNSTYDVKTEKNPSCATWSEPGLISSDWVEL